jgi:hypothetical protein
MLQPSSPTEPARASTGVLLQGIAIALCIVFGLTMIANNQMGGEGMWFWYDHVFLSGAKIYSQLHIALQPFYLLETSAWMRLVGQNLMALETLTLLHIFAMCAAIYLILRFSPWPGWLKAVTLFGIFALTVCGHSYRFDDYHVVAEDFIYFALLLLLHIARSRSKRHELLLAATLGVLSGLTIVTRVTDGAALLAAAFLCLLLIPLRSKLLSLTLLVVAAIAAVLLTVHLTGDSFSAYLSSSIFHAAASKGGTSSIFAAPLLTLRRTLPDIDKHVLAPLLAILAIGPLVYRYWRAGLKFILPLQLAALALIVCLAPQSRRFEALRGSGINVSVLILTGLLYVLPIVVLIRYLLARRAGLAGRAATAWDPREVFVLLPLAEWASYSAGAGGDPLTNYYAPACLLLLLVAVYDPFRKYAAWAYSDFAFFMLMLALSSVIGKVIVPYSWQNYINPPMFQNRQLYHHPVFGLMYIDKDALKFGESVCKDIGAKPGQNAPPLLSLPYPHENYFCDTPPWHNYVQTFFDTSPRATIEHLMVELNTAPPEWIVYQRQLFIMRGSEHLYNHDKPIAQHDLDTMIMNKLATHQWKLIEYSKYLYLYPDDGWYVIQTHP